MKNLLLIFGGQSSEHDISCISASYIASQVDLNEYRLILVGITRKGHWLKADSIDSLQDGSWEKSETSAVLSPDATEKSIYFFSGDFVEKIKIDVVFPVLHGLYGEDGTIQGILTLAQIPYVGCDTLSSAVAMDKAATKRLVGSIGIRQAECVILMREDLQSEKDAIAKVESKLSYPVFVKPSEAGSSKGIGKVEKQEDLYPALLEAARHDVRILVEEAIVGRELECAVFSDGHEIIASPVGEIYSDNGFYDFNEKYHSDKENTTVNPSLQAGVEEEIREKAIVIFRLLGGYSLSRVDFFLDKDGVVFNEINTLPGFTPISMYPQLFQKAGFDGKKLVKKLLESAFVRPEHFTDDTL